MKRVVERVDALIPAQPKALRVCAYARISTGKDAMLHSLSAQVSYYSKMIQSHNGWMYCGVYSDEAVTGTKRERAGFQHMIEECRQGNIDLVITKSISRFARNTVTLLQAVREPKSLGVDVFFEEQHIHTMSADGELMMTILASYAHGVRGAHRRVGVEASARSRRHGDVYAPAGRCAAQSCRFWL